jgi:glycosyltransferase involved in cell wall biosynthesis
LGGARLWAIMGAVQGDDDEGRPSGTRDLRPVRLSIVAPCFNEADNLDELVSRVGAAMDALPFASELVLVDDGSTDGTWPAMERLRAGEPRLVLRRHPRNRGIVEAWRTAVEAARAELVCVIDADLQYQPEDIARLVAAREAAGVEVSQGARRYEWPARSSRYWLSRGFNALVNGAFGMSLPDNKSAFMVCRREVLAEALSFRGRYHAWQNLVMVSLYARGHRSVSVATAFAPRRRGASFLADFPVRHGVRSLLDVAVALREYGRVTPPR